jgi:hypothetical protein
MSLSALILRDLFLRSTFPARFTHVGKALSRIKIVPKLINDVNYDESQMKVLCLSTGWKGNFMSGFEKIFGS